MGIFEPFRAIGYITSTVPFSVQRLGTETFVTVSVGKVFQIYNCAMLNLIIISPPLRKKIRALASYRDFTFAAFGSQEGPLQLWNINTKKMLYEFKGWGSSVCCCVSSPALDVVAIGCADGKIHVHNFKLDQEIITFEHASRAAVTALSFSTDERPLLASGGSFGVISIWNLNKRRLQSVIRDAHDSSIISLKFLANEPVLMSASVDNSLKMWIFDTNDGDPRLLRFRSGHSGPPLCISGDTLHHLSNVWQAGYAIPVY